MQEEETAVGEEALDSQGILGWEKVDRLTRALLRLRGLCVTNTQAVEKNSSFSYTRYSRQGEGLPNGNSTE